MATKKIRIKEKTTSGFNTLHPETEASIVSYSGTIGGTSVTNVGDALDALNSKPSGGATHLYKHVLTVNSSNTFSDYYAHDIIIISTSNSTTNYTAVINGAINLYQGKVVFILEDYSSGDYYLFGVDSYSRGEIICKYFDNYNGILVFDEYNPFNEMAITVSDVVTQIV